ncbi:MAG: hypothetical protein UC300_07145, partial [Prevotella sp.]|nr:hypothetical protein [Prevotella sp.]
PTELLLEWTCYALGMMPIKSGQSPNPTSITIINPKPIGNPTSITSINPKPITRPRIHHKHQPQTNHPPSHPSQASTPNQSPHLYLLLQNEYGYR